MLKSIELLWFEAISPFNESVFSFPMIGKLSMRQMLILGVGAVISWSLYQSTGDFMSAIPAVIGAVFALKKQKVLPLESMLLSVLMFYVMNGSSKKETRKNSKKTKQKILFRRKQKSKYSSTKLKFADGFSSKFDVIGKEIKTREIYSDPLKPIRMKIKVQKTTGQVIANTRSRILFDGNVISTLSTDGNGELEVIVIPKTTGEKKLQVVSEGFEKPVFEEILSVKA